MKKQSYSDLLKDPRWQKKRLEIMSRDKFICKKCGDTKTQLHVHHKEYIKDTDPWDYKNSFLITVCEDCHKAINEVKKECPEIKFDKIKIYKSNHWEGGGKIMFTSFPGNCFMQVYDNKGNFIVGFVLESEIPNIIKILKQSNYV
jgi:RNA polymerase subunit RPABC4/transcription elongation factor Spt4